MENEKSRRWLQKKSELVIVVKKGDVVKKIPAKEAKSSIAELLFPPRDERAIEIADEMALTAETIKQKVLFMEHIGIVDFLFEKYNLDGNASKVARILGLISDIKPQTIARELGNLSNEHSKIWVKNLTIEEKEKLIAKGKLKHGMEKIQDYNLQQPSLSDFDWLKKQYNLLDIEPLKKILSKEDFKNKK